MNAPKHPLAAVPSAPFVDDIGKLKHGRNQFTPRATECVRGHPRTPENITFESSCRICKNARRRLRRAQAAGESGLTVSFAEDARRIVADDAARFWSKVEKTDRCWLWKGVLSERGYGRLYRGGKRIRATHMSWFLRHGLMPSDGLILCHTCDNPPCVNPDHLFPGTDAQNTLDKILKGRGK